MSVSAITRLREERAGILVDLRRVLDAADADARDLTSEETQEYDRREERIGELDREIERRERLAGLQPAAGLAAEATRGAVAGDGEDDQERATLPAGNADERAFAAYLRRAMPGRSDADLRALVSDAYERAFDSYLRRGERGLSDAEARALSVGTNSAGGYTVPRGFYNQIVASLRQFGIVRQLATVLDTQQGNNLDIPTSSSFGTSGWGTEGGALTQSDPAVGLVTLSAYKSNHLALVSEELLQDTGVDLEGFLAARLGENLALLQNTGFVTGNGSGKPTGICDATGGATIGYTASNATSQVTAIIADSLFEVFHALAPQYRGTATWLMHDSSAKIIRKLKDTTNQYLWQPGLAAGAPDTMFGRPVVADPDVPTMAASARSIAFGDIRRGYFVRSAGGISVQRLNERYADTGQVGFRIFERVDGKIVDTNAIRLFQNAAS